MPSGWNWYWHRLRAMSRPELAAHIRRKLHQHADQRRLPDWSSFGSAPAAGRWPEAPPPGAAPEALRQALRHDAAEILAGRWRWFGHLAVALNDPPRWFRDHLVGRDLPTGRWGWQLNHRDLPRGADSKVIWEPSRWNELVRLAQAAHVLGENAAAAKCLAWLADWARGNPPFYGWNWTSALEAGLRLAQFCWLDALLGGTAAGPEFDRLRRRLLPPHAWFAWRYRSVGSSANNHLLGELAGLITVVARWPDLARWSAPLADLQRAFEGEVLAQFAPDGGNREQALNYHLFSWELAWHARNALHAAGRRTAAEVEERLRRAADFFVTMQVRDEPWDYGDSDNAGVTPLGLDDTRTRQEWWDWFDDPVSSPALRYWLGDPPPPAASPGCVTAASDWLVFPDSGQAVATPGDWTVRWDLSPLGYLATAAHGHLDALHLSLWLGGVALVIDPGTGAYYADPRLRAWLASGPAHNGPHVPGAELAQRMGPFLWAGPHATPSWRQLDEVTLRAEVPVAGGRLVRLVRRLADAQRDGWEVDDALEPDQLGGPADFAVCWQFAPGTVLESEHKRFHHGRRASAQFTVGLDAAWSKVELHQPRVTTVGHPYAGELTGVCSPAFRRLDFGPVIIGRARGFNPSRYRTTFLRETR